MHARILTERIKQLRQSRDLTQAQVAESIGVVVRTYSSWESGTTEPHAAAVAMLAKRYAVSADYLLGLTPTPSGIEPNAWLVDLDVVDAIRSGALKEIDGEAWSVPIPRRPLILGSVEYAALAREIATKVHPKRRK